MFSWSFGVAVRTPWGRNDLPCELEEQRMLLHGVLQPQEATTMTPLDQRVQNSCQGTRQVQFTRKESSNSQEFQSLLNQ